MHVAFYRPNQTNSSVLTSQLMEDLTLFTKNCLTTLNEINNILSFNKIWKNRLYNIGVYTTQTAISFNLSGVLLRCTGIKYDLRLNWGCTYAYYNYINFISFVGFNGDSYDRFLIRMNEMIVSLYIITKVTQNIFKKNYIFKKHKITPTTILIKKNKTSKLFMENIINHFKYWVAGFKLNSSLIYSAVESAKGEFGVCLLTNNTNKPYRCKIKAPSYINLNFLHFLCQNIMLADLITIIGTIDIVFGECDR